jgi:hypothetical protein
MTTIKDRINITADVETKTALKKAAQREKIPVATKAAELIRIGLALEEDSYLAKLALNREKTKGKYLTHAQVWK